MKLIGSLTSPYVRKVRVVLAEKKLDYKLVLEDPWSDPPSLNEANPLGQVPCLMLEGGDTLFDSRVIVEYVDTLSPVGRLIPEKGRERAEVRTWEALADGLLDAAGTAVSPRTKRGSSLSSAAASSALRSRSLFSIIRSKSNPSVAAMKFLKVYNVNPCDGMAQEEALAYTVGELVKQTNRIFYAHAFRRDRKSVV